jgi:hypothetical protein
VNPNTELLLAKVEQSSRWEDEEKATYGVEQLRERFHGEWNDNVNPRAHR